MEGEQSSIVVVSLLARAALITMKLRTRKFYATKILEADDPAEFTKVADWVEALLAHALYHLCADVVQLAG